jgi:hypothetical protein
MASLDIQILTTDRTIGTEGLAEKPDFNRGFC